jgi:hypothetical protein
MVSGDASFRMKYTKKLLLICCPLCFEFFEKDPSVYVPGSTKVTDLGKRRSQSVGKVIFHPLAPDKQEQRMSTSRQERSSAHRTTNPKLF